MRLTIAQGGAVDSIIAGIRPLDTVINRISNDFHSELPQITKKTDRAELKTELRARIDRFEDLYRRI